VPRSGRGAAFARANYRESVNSTPELPADRFYDAGDQGSAGPGPKGIRDLLESLRPGRTLEGAAL